MYVPRNIFRRYSDCICDLDMVRMFICFNFAFYTGDLFYQPTKKSVHTNNKGARR